jgi:hypothetical protein
VIETYRKSIMGIRRMRWFHDVEKIYSGDKDERIKGKVIQLQAQCDPECG